MTVTWEEFITRFNKQFISSATKVGVEKELVTLEQEEMTVADYVAKFTSIFHFTWNMYHTEERIARVFEKGLRP